MLFDLPGWPGLGESVVVTTSEIVGVVAGGLSDSVVDNGGMVGGVVVSGGVVDGVVVVSGVVDNGRVVDSIVDGGEVVDCIGVVVCFAELVVLGWSIFSCTQ